MREEEVLLKKKPTTYRGAGGVVGKKLAKKGI